MSDILEDTENNYDFSCYVLKYEKPFQHYSRGELAYTKDLFKGCDGDIVPLCWNYQHYDQASVLGHAILKNREDGVYVYGRLTDTSSLSREDLIKMIKENETIMTAPYVSRCEIKDGRIIKGRITSISLILERFDKDDAYRPVLKGE